RPRLVMTGRPLPYFKSVFELFQKSYPAIKLMFEPGRGGDHFKRVSAERRAGLYKVDLGVGGANSLNAFAAGMLDPISNALILPEVTPQSAWWKKKMRFTDQAQGIFLNISSTPQNGTL